MPEEGFSSRTSQLDLYKLLIDEVNKAVEKSSAGLLAQLKSATESMEKKADDNFRLLSARIDENRLIARGENERMVAKIDHIVDVLGQGNARFAVIEQRVTTIEGRCDDESGRRHARGQTPTVYHPAFRPAEEKKPASQKMNPFVVALLGAVAAALGGAIVTWVINGGLTVTPHAPTTTSPKTP
jgi:hypothetical protein